MVNGKIAQPVGDIGVQPAEQRARCLPKGVELVERVLGALRPNPVQQLVDIHVRKGKRSLFDDALANLGAPREVAAKLLVVHHGVGWEVPFEGSLEREIVFPVLHEAGLLDEQLGSGNTAVIPVAEFRPGKLLHVPVLFWQEIAHLGAGEQDGLVFVHPIRKGAALRKTRV